MPPLRPLAEFFFVPQARTLVCLMAFLISTFQLFYFPRYQGVPNLHQGALCPLNAPQWIHFCTQSEYFTMSNCVFNFNILALVVSRILRGPKFTLGCPVPPSTPLAEIFFVPQASTLVCLMAFSISTFQLFYLPRYQGGPKLTLGGPTPPRRPLAEKFFTQSEYFTISNCVF